MVNPEAGTVSIFDTATNARLAELPVGARAERGGDPPRRQDAPTSPTAPTPRSSEDRRPRRHAVGYRRPLAVGAEPTGLALSPTGATLYVAEWAEGRIAVIDDRERSTETGAIAAPRNPRGVAVTNDGDADDDRRADRRAGVLSARRPGSRPPTAAAPAGSGCTGPAT
jgi:DNA-binding beta-propeller fold protein YncE